jgi:hypothetical protein
MPVYDIYIYIHTLIKKEFACGSQKSYLYYTQKSEISQIDSFLHLFVHLRLTFLVFGLIFLKLIFLDVFNGDSLTLNINCFPSMETIILKCWRETAKRRYMGKVSKNAEWNGEIIPLL